MLTTVNKNKNIFKAIQIISLNFYGDWIHLVTFPHFLFKGDNFGDFLFAFLYTDTFWKAVYSKRKEFAPF